MVNAQRRAGTQWETLMAGFFREQFGFDGVTRLALRGRHDIGDLGGFPPVEFKPAGYQTAVPVPLIAGCKNEKRIELAEYMDELAAQTRNYLRTAPHQNVLPLGVEFVKRRGHGPARGYAVMEAGSFAELWSIATTRGRGEQ